MTTTPELARKIFSEEPPAEILRVLLKNEARHQKGQELRERIKYELLDQITSSLSVQGADLLPQPGEETFIVFGPHTGWAEMMWLERILEENGLDFRVMTKASNFKTFMRYLLSDKYFGVKRHEVDRKALNTAHKYLTSGIPIVTALEGTRQRGDTRPLHEAELGPVYIAHKASIPITVAVTLGAEHLSPEPEEILKKQQLFGKPVGFAPLYDEILRLREVEHKPELSVNFTAVYTDHLHDLQLSDRKLKDQKTAALQKHSDLIMTQHIIPQLLSKEPDWPLGDYEHFHLPI